MEKQKATSSFYHPRSLTFRIPVMAVSIALAVAAIVGITLLYETLQIANQKRYQQLRMETDYVEKELLKFNNRMHSRLDELVNDQRMIALLNSSQITIIEQEEMEWLLAEHERLVNDHKSLFIITQQKNNQFKLIGQYLHKADLAFPYAIVKPWLNMATAESGNSFSQIARVNQQVFWIFGQKLTGTKQETILFSMIEFEHTAEVLSGITFNQSNLILADQQGRLLLDTISSENIVHGQLEQSYPSLFIFAQNNPKQKELAMQVTVSNQMAMGHLKRIVLAQDEISTVLNAFVLQSDDVFIASFEELKERGILIAIILIVVVLVLAIVSAKRLTSPLSAMIANIHEYQRTGKLGTLPVKSSDEIGVLSQSFKQMMSQVVEQTENQKQAYEQASAMSAKLQSILNSVVDAVINIDEKGEIIAFNRAAEDIFGYTEEEVLGENVRILMPEKFASQHDGFIQHYIMTGQQKIINTGRELPAVRKDGEVFPMFLSVSEVQSQQGKIFTGLIRDITANKIMESESKRILQSANELAWRLDFALSGPQVGVWDLDLSTNNVTWDKRMYRLYGVDISDDLTPDEVWQRALHPSDKITVTAAIKKSINTGIDFNQVFRIILPNKVVNYIQAHARVFYDDSGQISRLVGTNHDVTEQHHLHELKQQALDMAEDSLRLKSEFLASMSHEIRTPMNGVLGMLNLMYQTKLDKQQIHYLNLASSSAKSLLTLINDILDFSKIEAGKLELESLDFDARSQLGEVAESLAVKAQDKGLELVLDVNYIGHETVKGDPTRLRQIVSNLVSNAIKFTEKGEIVIRAHTEQIADDDVYLHCSVSDSGIGIPEDKVIALFDSFTQVDASTTRKYGGTGLGLAIVKQLCELMDGNISVTSEEGKGSTFEFCIKLKRGHPIHVALPSIEIAGRKILIVDDNETNLEVLKGQLEQWGADISEAQSGIEALMLVNKKPEQYFDVAILDMQMPAMDGATLGQRLKAERNSQHTKLIMMTSMGTTGDAEYFAKLGFSAYFPKPATTSDLFDALNVVLEGGEALDVAQPLVTHESIQALQRPQEQQIDASTKVLIVEDNRINQAVVTGVLASWGCQAEVAENGLQAIDMLAKPSKHYDVVLMDCQMPEMDGYQASRYIRSGENSNIKQDIPIIAMTANAMKGDREKCIASGMDDYLPKPLDADLLLEKLLHYLPSRLVNKSKTSEATVKSKRKSSTLDESRAVDESSTAVQEEQTIWDKDALLNRVRQNQELANKLIMMFLEDADESVRSLLMAMNKKQLEEVISQAHKLKGSVKNLGGIKLAQVIITIEKNAKQGHSQELKQLAIIFEQAFDEFVAALKTAQDE